MQPNHFGSRSRANTNENAPRSSTNTAPSGVHVPPTYWAANPPTAPITLPQPQALAGFHSLNNGPTFPSSSEPSQYSVQTSVTQPSEATSPMLSRPAYGVPSFGPLVGRPLEQPIYPQSSSRSSLSDASTTVGGQRAFAPLEPPRVEAPTDASNAPDEPARRCHLYIRQQPRAARAGPDGKDRRAIDPPPILQLLMDDFDPDSESDVAELQTQWWVVYCSLVAAQSPDTNVTTMPLITEDGRTELHRLLLGTHVANVTPTADDPDPPTMPLHPITKPKPAPTPPSPTSRFLPASSRSAGRARREAHQVPGAFFIFADLSVRKAGEYRLRFDLMRLDDSNLVPGACVPCTNQVISQVFRVVNAKDFDQVQPSTNLVRGLLERGAGFPLKLKKGTREGQRRRRRQSGQDSDDDSNVDDNYD
ncbi:hypothetical protein A1O1_00352 [Capronia coronata CBS 617.96]|uniref:Velvet domain-containing protein n=1 Tax=Capronia coronata CBS 617.96 TaxID=1182541 RepID=W9YQN5_9EURO|nr:uncharacterized protein A1O1_00352 [Capronia coronata CBS 617.96]EXJ95232.1 hypothetical protein A1O1_00352 [Capronia coronata CBS 617.96]